jgi:hypothetical protein
MNNAKPRPHIKIHLEVSGLRAVLKGNFWPTLQFAVIFSRRHENPFKNCPRGSISKVKPLLGPAATRWSVKGVLLKSTLWPFHPFASRKWKYWVPFSGTVQAFCCRQRPRQVVRQARPEKQVGVSLLKLPPYILVYWRDSISRPIEPIYSVAGVDDTTAAPGGHFGF